MRTRGEFIKELSQLVRDLGGEPAAARTDADFAPFSALRVWLVGDHAGDRYAACSRVEERTRGLYDKALELSIPKFVRVVLERQQVQIASDGDEWRIRRFI